MPLIAYFVFTLQLVQLIFGAPNSKPTPTPAKSPYANVYNATIANGFVTFVGGGNPIPLTNGMTSSSIQVCFALKRV